MNEPLLWKLLNNSAVLLLCICREFYFFSFRSRRCMCRNSSSIRSNSSGHQSILTRELKGGAVASNQRGSLRILSPSAQLSSGITVKGIAHAKALAVGPARRLGTLTALDRKSDFILPRFDVCATFDTRCTPSSHICTEDERNMSWMWPENRAELRGRPGHFLLGNKGQVELLKSIFCLLR